MFHVLTDPELGRVYIPERALAATSAAGRATRQKAGGEVGVFIATQRRARLNPRTGKLEQQLIWASVSHNERVDAGADKQAKQTFGGGSSPGAPSATVYFQTIAVANASLTKAKGDQSLGSTSANATTNEFTTIGLSRAVGSVTSGYTAPASLGATFAQVVSKLFTASGSGTAYGAGLLDSTTVSGSILYVEDNFSSTAVLVSGDTLTVTITINN